MTTETVKLTVSVPKNLKVMTDRIAKEKKISRSKVVSQCLTKVYQERLHSEMEEGYKALAKEQEQFVKEAFELQRKAVPQWE